MISRSVAMVLRSVKDPALDRAFACVSMRTHRFFALARRKWTPVWRRPQAAWRVRAASLAAVDVRQRDRLGAAVQCAL